MNEHAAKPKKRSDSARRRLRDFIILTSGSAAVLTLLLFTSAIGLVEWITGAVVMVAGSLAYYVGSQPPVRSAARPDDQGKAQKPVSPLEAVVPVLSSVPFPALLIGDNNRIFFANRDAQSVFRLTRPSGDLVSAAIREPVLIESFGRAAGGSTPERIEISFGDEDASWMAHVQTGPEPGTVIAILEDRTAVRRAERARVDFLANASHELRTPLTAISGFVETMRGPAKDDKESWDNFLEIIHEQTERMQRLVADLLSLSRIEFSEHRAPSTKEDMRELTREVGEALKPVASGKGASLTVSLPEEPVPIIADRDEITQVIQNLVSNAIKYGSKPDGTIAIELGMSDTMEEAERMCSRQMNRAPRVNLLAPRASAKVPAMWLRVKDEGEGISSQHLPRLGERFYRTDESRGGKITGTGLGLAIVKHIMARHRGGFAVESIENQGSAFGIWMPIFVSSRG